MAGKPMWHVLLPLEAMTDTELTAIDFRMLGAVAIHDRTSKNARGCFAGHATLARIAQCDISTAERSLKRLAERGHLTRQKSSTDARRWVYRVCYPSRDLLKDQELPRIDAGDFIKDTPHSDGEYPARILNSVVENQELSDPKLTNKHIVLNEEAHAGEPAPIPQFAPRPDGIGALVSSLFPSRAVWFTDDKGAFNAGGFLAWSERNLSAGRFSKADFENLMQVTEAIMDAFECGSPEYGVAFRLINKEFDEDVRDAG